MFKPCDARLSQWPLPHVEAFRAALQSSRMPHLLHITPCGLQRAWQQQTGGSGHLRPVAQQLPLQRAGGWGCCLCRHCLAGRLSSACANQAALRTAPVAARGLPSQRQTEHWCHKGPLGLSHSQGTL